MPGLDLKATDEISKKTYHLAISRLKKVKLILFILEYPHIVAEDFILLKIIRKSGKTILGLLNKIDNPDMDLELSGYFEMGLNEIIPISALGRWNLKKTLERIHYYIYGNSVEQYRSILDNVRLRIKKNKAKIFGENADTDNTNHLDKKKKISDLDEKEIRNEIDKKENLSPLKLAIIGKPNCGKSSLVNKIIGYEKVLVTNISGTTKDSTDTHFKFHFKDYSRNLIILDTAGIRKKVNQSKGVEFYSYTRSKRAIKEADVVLHILDCSTKPIISKADKKIGEHLKKILKTSLLVLNKWDIYDLKKRKFNEFLDDLYRSFPFTRDQKIITVSALTGKRVPQMVDEAVQLAKKVKERIPTSELNRLLEKIIRNAPDQTGKKWLKINYAVQYAVSPIKIKLFVKNQIGFSENILTYIKKRISKEMAWEGIPIGLEIEETSKKKMSDRY